MNPDDEVCLCYHVSLRKIRNYCTREDPPVASLISECLGAGSGCGWCVPFLNSLHEQHCEGVQLDLWVSPEQYASARKGFHKTGERNLKPEATRQINDEKQKNRDPAESTQPDRSEG